MPLPKTQIFAEDGKIYATSHAQEISHKELEGIRADVAADLANIDKAIADYEATAATIPGYQEPAWTEEAVATNDAPVVDAAEQPVTIEEAIATEAPVETVAEAPLEVPTPEPAPVEVAPAEPVATEPTTVETTPETPVIQ